MKRKIWLSLLGLEAILCILLGVAQPSGGALFAEAAAFPFEQLGLGLRALSLSGSLGNILAILLYALVGVLPLIALLRRRLRGRARGEDVLLVFLSAALFAVLYLMVNPADIRAVLGELLGLDAGRAVLGGTVYSIFFGYLVLRVLRLFFDSGTEKLPRFLAVMLNLLNALFVYAIFGACFGGMLDAFRNLLDSNQGSESLLGLTYVFLVLQFLVDSVPYALNMAIVLTALRLASALREDRYSAASVDLAETLSRRCRMALVVTTVSQVGFNILQMLFAKKLMTINSLVQIPVLSILFVLVMLLIARYLAQSKLLKDDNDMFV